MLTAEACGNYYMCEEEAERWSRARFIKLAVVDIDHGHRPRSIDRDTDMYVRSGELMAVGTCTCWAIIDRRHFHNVLRIVSWSTAID